MSLFETTRELVKRGCPEHPRLLLRTSRNPSLGGMVQETWCLDTYPVDESDARDLWTMHALRWFNKIADRSYDVVYNVDDVLTLIEIHTRHLAATANLSPGGGE